MMIIQNMQKAYMAMLYFMAYRWDVSHKKPSSDNRLYYNKLLNKATVYLRLCTQL